MDVSTLNKLSWLPQSVLNFLEKQLGKIPSVREQIDREYDSIFTELEKSMKPYDVDFPAFSKIPETAIDREKVISDMEALQEKEQSRWQNGFVSGAVYHGDAEHIDFLNRVYAINSQSNPLHADLWPSATKYEAEVIAMTANMLNGDEKVCGSVSSGGTESILLAMKTYRDWAHATKNITRPEMVVPVTAHAAFDKAAEYFKIKIRKFPIGVDYKADIAAARKAINRNTIVLVGSAPCFPHGIIDPIEELSELAYEKKIGFHTDACLGGFVLPWAEKLGYNVPPFDFRLRGVTSISADTHKYGYAAKGSSVVLYRTPKLRQHQYFTATDWPGGIYFSPTFAGSRPGALSATCWAAMISVGQEGYLTNTTKILETAAKIKKGIDNIPEIYILGEPLWVIAFASPSLDIYRVMDFMTRRNWNLNGLHKPACVHLCVTLRHTQPGVAKKFIADLKAAVAHVKATPAENTGMAPVYGMAATIPMRGMVSTLLKKYMDILYKV